MLRFSFTYNNEKQIVVLIRDRCRLILCFDTYLFLFFHPIFSVQFFFKSFVKYGIILEIIAQLSNLHEQRTMYEDRVCVCYQRERVCIDLDRDRGLNLYFTCIAKKCLFIRWNDYFKINAKKFCPRSQKFCCITNNRAYIRFHVKIFYC